MPISKSKIGSIKDLILAEISHDILELPRKKKLSYPILQPWIRVDCIA